MEQLTSQSTWVRFLNPMLHICDTLDKTSGVWTSSLGNQKGYVIGVILTAFGSLFIKPEWVTYQTSSALIS